jgi:hypothetical protein
MGKGAMGVAMKNPDLVELAFFIVGVSIAVMFLVFSWALFMRF